MAASGRRFDPFQVPLSGLQLVEASAGTGKTWTIAGLYLRLVVETGRLPESILVVTFTRAATAELGDRIRRRLVEARQALEGGGGDGGDPFLAVLRERCATVGPELALQRLTAAIRAFDEAAIHTIHGFCQRALADSAFESRVPFELELAPDEGELLEGVVADFWRRRFYGASSLFLRYALGRGLSPAALREAVRPHLGRGGLRVEAPRPPVDLAALEAAYTEAWQRARGHWLADGPAITQLLLDAPTLNRSRYRRDQIPKWAATLDVLFAAEEAALQLPERLERLSSASLAQAATKGPAPEHPFFPACGALLEAFQSLDAAFAARCRALVAALLEEAGREMEARKIRLRLQSYNDLPARLHRGLEDPLGGEALARSLRDRYSAALIDEFQDTDPVQYGIFRRIYGSGDCPVFLVGDPKQAIYSFRGADLFAYLRARRDARQTHELQHNWRSDPPLIAAVNAVFQRHPAPFLLADIPYHPVAPAPRDPRPLEVDGDPAEPLVLWWLAGGADKPLGKGVAGERIAAATAAEVARLLNLGARGRARLGDGAEPRGLGGGDIAVLVRTNQQGLMMQRALAALGVASVQQAVGSVFKSAEAGDLERLLRAAAEPGREAAVRAALATETLGLDGEALHSLAEDETAWEARLERFHGYSTLWRERGFMAMFRRLLEAEGVSARLLAYADGERRLTNLLHLAELLQGRWSREPGGPEGLIQWLAERRGAEGEAEEEALLRLESDEHLVTIVTVHKSKGLEYPVVFCPFLWDGRLRAGEKGREAALYHDPGADHAAVLDLGTARLEAAKALARREEFAENLRLLYVALTRARHRCYLAWGRINEAASSSLAWLLHPRKGDEIPEELPPEQVMRADLQALAADSAGAIRLAALPEGEAEPFRPPPESGAALAARRFAGAVPAAWRVTSFTALAAGHGPESPDYDAGVAVAEPAAGAAPAGEPEPGEGPSGPPAPEAPGIGGEGEGLEQGVVAGAAPAGPAPAPVAGIFAFPRGARAGRCLHALLEALDFAAAGEAELRRATEQALRSHGIAAEWTPVVAAQIRRVLDAPLAGDLRLRDLAPGRRLDEMEFTYPLAPIDTQGLQRLLEAAGSPWPVAVREHIGRLSFAPVHGYMKGFIDLVFEHRGRWYLADYKSNWLGPAGDDYRPPRLAAAMGREAYYLQYLVYTVALHRFLGRRLPGYDYERHFGGVFYLFLRGMDPAAPGQGVFHDRPQRSLVEALDAYFAGGGSGAGTGREPSTPRG